MIIIIATNIREGGEDVILKLKKKNNTAVNVVKLLACSTGCTGGSCPPPDTGKQYSNAGKK